MGSICYADDRTAGPSLREAEAIVGRRGAIVFCHAISTANECQPCATSFRKDLEDLDEDPDALVLSEADQLLVDFGRAAALQADSFPPQLLDRLKSVFTDAQLTVLTGFAGLMIATNIFKSILRVGGDAPLTRFPPWTPEVSQGRVPGFSSPAAAGGPAGRRSASRPRRHGTADAP